MASRARRTNSSQQQRNLIVIVGLVVAVIAIIIIAYIQFGANETFRIDDPRFAAFAGIPLEDDIDTNREIDKADDVADGVVQGFLEDGTPFIGDPDAPIVFAEFSDFACPHCADFAPEVEVLIEQYVRNGMMRFEYRPMTFIGGEFSRIAASAAVCAGEQGAFWEYHKELFRYQQTQGANSFTVENMASLADDLGLDDGELRSCVNSNRPERALRAAAQLASEYGVNSTPTIAYRGADDETWSRFYDANGEAVSRVSLQEMSRLIESYNGSE